MMELMKKIPGGNLLIPMLISSIVFTLFPNIYDIGGVTKALFSGQSIEFILGSAVFISGCSLSLQTLKKVIGRYGPLLLFRLILNIILGLAFVHIFSLEGIFGISAIAFIATITSINPTLFLGYMNEYGDEVDVSAFGLVSMFATPVIPMFIYGLTSSTQLDFKPMISMLIPLFLGSLIANLDKELGTHLSSGIGYIIVLLGWNLGSGINLIKAVSAGIPGVLMFVLYCVLNLPPLYIMETKLMKRKGYSSIGLSTIAGLSASVPIMMSKTNLELTEYATNAAAVVTMGVVLSSVFTSFLVRRLNKKYSLEQ